MRIQAGRPLWPTLFFSVLGLLWCAYVAFPTDIHLPCATSGCEIFRDSKFAGISLWWVGGAFFLAFSLLCLLGQRLLAWLMIITALFLDAILLVIMLFTAPCLDCLVVAAIMALCACTLVPWAKSTRTFAALSLLIPVWFGLFLANSVLSVNEQVSDYTIGTTTNRDIRLYFSPSCPACREAVRTLGDRAALYPVEEKEGDFESILIMEQLLREGLSPIVALEQSLLGDRPAPALSLSDRAALSMQLLRNKAAVMRQGFRALPLIQINGMPKGAVVEKERPATVPNASRDVFGDAPLTPRTPGDRSGNDQGLEGLPDFLNGTGELGQCGGDSPEPCD